MAAATGRLAQDDRLEDVLWQVVVDAGAGQRVVGQALRVGAPGVQARELVAGEAGAEHRVAHQRLRHALGLDLALEAHVAHDLDGPLVGDVRARRVRRPAVFRDDQVPHAVGAQEQRARAARRAGPDDQDVRLDHGASTRSYAIVQYGSLIRLPSGASPGSWCSNGPIRLLRTPKTASESRYASPSTKTWVIRRW